MPALSFPTQASSVHPGSFVLTPTMSSTLGSTEIPTASATVCSRPPTAGRSDSVTIPGSSIETEDPASHRQLRYSALAYEAAQKAKKQNDGTQPPSCSNNRREQGALIDGGMCPLNSRPPPGLLHGSVQRDAKSIGKPSSNEVPVNVQYEASFSFVCLPEEAKPADGFQLYWGPVGAQDREKDSGP